VGGGASIGISPTSPKNGVSLSTSSRRPICWVLAPVNAPFSLLFDYSAEGLTLRANAESLNNLTPEEYRLKAEESEIAKSVWN